MKDVCNPFAPTDSARVPRRFNVQARHHLAGLNALWNFPFHAVRERPLSEILEKFFPLYEAPTLWSLR